MKSERRRNNFMKYVHYFLISNGMYSIEERANLNKKIFFYAWRFLNSFIIGISVCQFILGVYFKPVITLVNSSANIMNSLIYFASLLRMLYYFYKSDSIKKIIDKINYTFEYESMDAEEVVITMKDTSNVVEGISLFWYVQCIIMTNLVVSMPYIDHILNKSARILPIDAWYPFDWRVSPYFEIVYLFQASSQFVMTIPYANADLFFSCTVLLIGKQFEILARDMKNIYFTQMLRENFNKEDVIDFFKKVYGPYNDKMSEGVTFNRMWKKLKDEKFHARIEERLKDYIKVHQSLLDFCVEIETFFSPILLLSYFYGAIYIVFIGVSVIIANDTSFLHYLISALFEMFTISYSSQYLTDCIEKFRVVIFEMPWYAATQKVKVIYLFMQLRTVKHFQMTASGLLDVSLQTFIAMCRMCVSYFTVLQQLFADN